MILLLTWDSHTQAREKQPPLQQLQLQQHYYEEVLIQSGSQVWVQYQKKVAETEREKSSENGLCERRDDREREERATTQLSAGPSRPTSCKKREVKPKERKEVTIVCWAVSPRQSVVPWRQKRRIREDGNAVRRQPGELYYIYRNCVGVNVKVGWVRTGHRAIWCHCITIGALRR